VHGLSGLVALNLCFLVWGYGLLVVARRPLSPADCGLAFCAGFGGLSSVACIVAVAVYVPGVVAVSVVSGIVAVPLAIAIRRSRPLRSPRGVSIGEAVPVALVGLAAAAYSALLLREAYVRPLAEWDAWAIWTVKAKALVTLGHLGAVGVVGAEPAYPPLVPMMQSLAFRFVGSPDSQIVHVEYALLVIAFAGSVWRLLGQRASALAGATGALAVLMLPGLARNVPDALADVPVAVFSALAALFLAAWIVDRHGPALVLFAAFGAFAAWTKNEGSMLVLTLGIVGVAASVSRRPKTSLAPLLATAAALGATAPWRIWTATRGVHVDTPLGSGLHFGYLHARLPAAGTIATNFWDHVGNAHAWFAAPYLLVALSIVVFAKGRRRLAAFCLAAPAVAFVLFVWAYMIRNDPLGVQWLLNTSAARTTTSIGLLAAVLVFFEAATLLDAPSRGGPR
jgi:hypothetical protein